MQAIKSDKPARPPPPKNYRISSTTRRPPPPPPPPPPPRLKMSTNPSRKKSTKPVAPSRTFATFAATKDSGKKTPKNIRKKSVNIFKNLKGKISDKHKPLKRKPDVKLKLKNAPDKSLADKSQSISAASDVKKLIGGYKQLNTKIENVIASTNRKFKVASVTTDEKLKKAAFINGKYRWFSLISAKVILFLVELFCVGYLSTSTTENSIFLSYIPVYGRKSKITIVSIITCSCFTNLIGVTTTFFYRKVTIWSRNLPINYMIWMTCQLSALLVGFSVTGVALKNLNEAITTRDMLPVLKELRTHNDLHYFVDRLQNEKSCCGINGPKDWKKLNLSIPRSCCNNHNCSNPYEHLHMYGCYNYIVDDAEAELQLLLTTIGLIVFLQIPVFFATCLSFPNMKILRRFIKEQLTYDAELSIKLNHLQRPHANIQNSNIKSRTFPMKNGASELMTSTMFSSSDKISLDRHYKTSNEIKFHMNRSRARTISNSNIDKSIFQTKEEANRRIQMWLLNHWLPFRGDAFTDDNFNSNEN